MDRRKFLKQAACGTAAIAVGMNLPFMLGTARAQHGHAPSGGPVNTISLGMATANVEMVDTIQVPHWVYTVDGHPTLPGPFIFAYADESFTIEVTNNINDGRLRRFAIVGTTQVGNSFDPFANLKLSDEIAPGGTGSVTVNAGDLKPGTYLYKDPTLGAVSRVLGLHGALVILPARGNGAITNPFGQFSTPNVTALFNDLGSGTPLRSPQALFPGQPWYATTDDNPGYRPRNMPPSSDSDWLHYDHFHEHPVLEKFFYRTRIWLHSAIDPVLNRYVINGVLPSAQINGLPDFDFNDEAQVRNNHLPQYFSINGRQGVYSAHSHDITATSSVGQPFLIRMVNAGLVTHSPHFHGNHIYPVSDNNRVGGFVHYADEFDAGQVFEQDIVPCVDTITLGPESRYDVVFPFIRPPDIPRLLDNQGNLRPLAELLQQELDVVAGGVAQDPITYPMHCHTEMAQTAAGGNYPQGQVIHIEFTGEFGRFFKPRKYGSIVPIISPLLLGD